MSHAATASLKVLVYLASLASALVGGHLVAAAVGDAMPHHMPAASALMAACALAVLVAGSWAEERMLWRGWFRPSRERLEWVGRSRSSFLTSGAPAPLCLGLALGLVSPFFI
jgi:hypothetical protein